MNIPKTLNELTPASYNPRIITEKSFNGLKASIGEFGDLSGIVFNLATGNLVAGHQRVNALKADGAGLNILIDNDRHYIEHKGERFYVRFVNWDMKKERLANVTANNPKIQGQWSDNVGVVLDEIVVDASPLLVDLQIPDLCDSLGIKDEELTAEEDGFDTSTDAVKTDIVQGDVFDIGEHRLMCGDSSMIDNVEKLMNGNKAQLLLTDPPYGIKRDKGFEGFGGFGKPIARREYADDWDSKRPEQNTFFIMLEKAKSAIIFGGNFFADILPASKHWLVWDKKNTMPTFGDCELAWTNIDRNSVKKYEVEYNGLIGKEKERFHPTQKPVKLLSSIIQDYTEANDLITDMFLGSGTTMVAAYQLKRKCYGMELDPKYCQVIINRMRKLDPNIVVKRNGEEYKS